MATLATVNNSSKPGKLVLYSSPMNASQYPGLFNGSDHEYTLFEPTAVANSVDWLHFNTFPSWEDTLPRTTGFFNTWKNSSPMNSS